MFRACQFYQALTKNNAFRSLVLGRTLTDKVLNVNTNIVKDVILFKYDNPRFFKLLNIFAICQFGFWGYLSHFAYTTLKNVPAMKDESVAWWRRINLGDERFKYTITIGAFLVGYGILAISWMYTLRSVRYLVLHKGGEKVSFVTYGPFGKNRILTVGLNNVCCKESRSSARAQLPIKVKNQYLHYILDMKGEFKNGSLFDHTAGLRRNLQS